MIHTVSNAHTCYDDPSNAVEKMAELSLSSERTLSVLLLLLLLSSDGDIPHHAGTRGRNPRVCLQVSLHPGLSPVNISVKILKAALPLLCFGSNPLGRTAGAAPDLVSCCPLPPFQAHRSVLPEMSIWSRRSPPLRATHSCIFSISGGGSSPSHASHLSCLSFHHCVCSADPSALLVHV